MNLREEKRRARREIRALAPSPVLLRAESEALCRVLLSWDVYREACCVAAFFPLPGEADISPLLRDAPAAGKRLVLPVTSADLSIAFYQAEDLSSLPADAWGIPAPDPRTAPPAEAEQIDLILVPLLAVDRKGFRLGKGGGCYDRYFAAHPGLLPRAAGIALEHQLAEQLPAEPLDCRLSLAVTPHGVIRFN